MSDLPSQYTENIETFRQILKLPDPRDNVPVYSLTLWGLNDVASRQELRPNFSTALTKVTSECNLTMEKCQDSIKATVKRIKSQILKGANPEKAARNCHEKICDYLDILNKRSLI